MQTNSLDLLIEINDFEFIFIVIESSDNNANRIILTDNIPLQGIRDEKIHDYNLVLSLI